MTRQEISTQSGSRIKRYERLFTTKVYNALQSEVLSFIANYKAYGKTYAEYHLKPNGRMEIVLRSLYLTITPAEATRTYGAIRKQYGVPVKRASFGYSATWNEDVKRYLDKFLLEKAVLPISETTKDWILRVLKRGIEEGKGVEEIVRELRDSDITRNRAMKIVRTESVRAANFGYMIGAYDSDYEMVKEWVAVEDGRTRRTHSHASGVDGEKRDLMKPFSNGLQYPGDPTAPAKETINCRCVVTFRVKRDAQGNPIVKRKPVVQFRRSVIDLLLAGLSQFLIQNAVDNLMSAE